MNVLSQAKKITVLKAICEGVSLRAVTRLTGVHRTTAMKLVLEIGGRCENELKSRIVGVSAVALEADELWSFIYKKERRLTDEDRKNHPERGDIYTFLAIDPDSKLIVSFDLGRRNEETTWSFIEDLRSRVIGNPEISTDAWQPYIPAIQRHFGPNANYGQIIKQYGAEQADRDRYAPSHVTGVKRRQISGKSQTRRVCTSYVERVNGTLRTHLRRYTRLSQGFSRKVENHRATLALFCWYYNFHKFHQTIKTVPGVAAGLIDRPLDFESLVA